MPPVEKNMSGGAGESAGECAPCSIDLTRPSDVQMVLRSIGNRWDPPQAMREAIAAQIPAALKFYETKVSDDESTHKRAASRLIKLVRLFVGMDAENLLAAHPNMKIAALGDAMPRRRYPERRRPRFQSRCV